MNTEVFFQCFRDQIIGITGTKGKSTVTTLLYHLLKQAGMDALLVGNIGIPALDHMEERPLSLPEALYLATKGPGEFFGKVGSFEPGYDFDALVVDVDELDGRLPRTPFEKLEQFLYDGDDRDILARYSRGSLVEKPFTE